jgi:hypothetical protein
MVVYRIDLEEGVVNKHGRIGKFGRTDKDEPWRDPLDLA